MKTLLILILAGLAYAQTPAHAPLALSNAVQDKNFYLLTLIERTPAVVEALRNDAELAGTRAAKMNQLHNSLANCAQDLTCYVNSVKLNADDLGQPRDALKRLYKDNAAVRRLVDGPMRESGAYVRYHEKPGEELLALAWIDAARAINNIIDVYGAGKAPRYPLIDSVTYDVKSESYKRVIALAAQILDEDRDGMPLFYQPALRFGLSLMQGNQRNEAGRLEPMEKLENAAAVKKIKTTDWSKYPYTAIVVPGSGTDRPGVAMSPFGFLRTQLAAKRYREGKAPFLIVSGGYVHPSQTPYCEALEMKRLLIREYGIPEDAILIDPHARHTTTNIRNAAREIYRYGMPFEKAALITTDPGQSATIESNAFRVRCMTELGYRPYANLKRLNAFDLEILPTVESLQIDAMDPLDP